MSSDEIMTQEQIDELLKSVIRGTYEKKEENDDDLLICIYCKKIVKIKHSSSEQKYTDSKYFALKQAVSLGMPLTDIKDTVNVKAKNNSNASVTVDKLFSSSKCHLYTSGFTHFFVSKRFLMGLRGSS